MRILLCVHVYAPSVGGIEKSTSLLVEQFCRQGASVTVVTQTPGGQVSPEYEVVRRPSLRALRALARKSDLVFQSNISLRTLLPLLFCGRPIVILHHVLSRREDGSLGWQDRLKRALLPLCHNLAVSQAVADEIRAKVTVIGPPFESSEFTVHEETSRDKDIVFFGRLFSQKGCDVALRAVALLKEAGICASFTIIGGGPEMPALQRLSVELGIADQVEFRGFMPQGVGRELARHKIIVVPSVWRETFGAVAVEGLAAGCVPVVSNTGGLPEAVGPCGLLVPMGDAAALAGALRSLLSDAGLREKLLAGRDRHLAQFQPQTIAARYMQFFETVLAKRPPQDRHRAQRG
jgi:glycosyltransferase involved in cell wall biosynthesis